GKAGLADVVSAASVFYFALRAMTLTIGAPQMRMHKITFALGTVFISAALLPARPSAQQANKSAVAPPVQLLTRTTRRHETARLNYGGTVTLIGAPHGAVTVEGWQRNEVEVTADIELQAETESELDQLAKVNSFVFDEDLNHVSILTIGTHDREFMKKTAKNFPKNLLNLPWKIDFRIRVPVNTDLEISAGHGPVTLSGVEGALRISATESETTLTLGGGTVSATITSGNAHFAI